MTSSRLFRNLPLIPIGRDLPEDPKDAVRWLERAADRGDSDAQYNLGVILLHGGKLLEAMNVFRHAYYQGHEPAGLQIGAMCRREDGRPATDEDIANWYRPIAEEGHPVAQFALAVIYEHGRGAEQSSAEAARWLRLAGKQGHRVAQAELGTMLEYGLGIEQDQRKATKWLLLAAAQGSWSARSILAKKYLYGHGVEQDAEEAERLLLLCCENGMTNSMAVMASPRALGRVIRKDHKQAVKWFRRVFDKADADTLYRFGHDLLTVGKVSEGDRFLAYTWFRLAAHKGHDVAWEACLSLERDLPANRLHASRMIARKSIRSHSRRKWRRHHRSRKK